MVTAAPTLSFDVDVTAGDGRWVRNANSYPVYPQVEAAAA